MRTHFLTQNNFPKNKNFKFCVKTFRLKKSKKLLFRSVGHGKLSLTLHLLKNIAPEKISPILENYKID